MKNKLATLFVILFLSQVSCDFSADKNSYGQTNLSSFEQVKSDITKGDTVSAKTKLNALVKNLKADSLLMLSDFLIKNNEINLAELCLKNIESKDKSDVYYYFCSIIMEKKNQVDSAGVLASMAFNINQSPTYINSIAMLYAKSSNKQKALNFINKFIAIAPNNPYIKVIKANVLIHLSKYDEALVLFQDAENELKIPEIYSGKAYVYSVLSDFTNAKLNIEKAFKMGDSSALNYLVKASILYNDYEYKEAMKAINIFLKNERTTADAYFIRALIHKELKEYNEALNDLETMRQIDSTDYRYYGAKGRVYQQTNNLKDAEKFFKIGLQKGDSSWITFYNELKRAKK
ncbi:MAG: hypothetical protein U0V03_09510 [Bacteroidia bacterium]